MKKILATILAAALAGGAWGEVTGSGTEADPYVVTTEAELEEAVAVGGFIRISYDGFMPVSSTLALTKNVTFLGGNMTSSATTAIVVPEGVTFTIVGSGTIGTTSTAKGSYCVDVQGGTFNIQGYTFSGHTAVHTAAGKTSTVNMSAGWSNAVTEGFLLEGTGDVVTITGGSLYGRSCGTTMGGPYLRQGRVAGVWTEKTQSEYAAVNIKGSGITLNMSEGTLEGSMGICVYPDVVGTVLNISGGTVQTKNLGTGTMTAGIVLYADTIVNISGTAKVIGNTSNYSSSGIMIWDGISTVTVTGGTITGSSAGIWESNYGDYGNAAMATINVSGSPTIKATDNRYNYGNSWPIIGGRYITITGGVFDDPIWGIYFQGELLTIDNSETETPITMKTVWVRGGKVVIKGNPEISTGYAYYQNYNTGSALLLTPVKDDQAIDVTVEGGTFIASNGYAIEEWKADAAKTVSLVVSGGTFTGNAEKGALGIADAALENVSVAITGGTYNSDPSAYVPEGYLVTDNNDGTYTVSLPPVAQADGTNYTSVDDAVAAVDDGTEITIIESTTIGSEEVAAGSTVTTTTSGTASEATSTPAGGGAAVTTTVTPKTISITGSGESEAKTVEAYVVSQGSGTDAKTSIVTDVSKDETVASADPANTEVSDFVDVGKVLADAVASEGIDAGTVTSMELSLVKDEKTAVEAEAAGLNSTIVAKVAEEDTKLYEVYPVATITTTTPSGESTTTYEVKNEELAQNATFTFELDFGVANAGKMVTLTHYADDGTVKLHNGSISWAVTLDDNGKATVTLESFSYLLGTVSEPYAVTSVQSANLFGAIKIESNTASNMYVAVPFEGFESDGAARKAQDVVHPANLADGVKMFAYDKENDKYNAYASKDGAWTATAKVTLSDTEEKAVEVENAPLGFGVAAGTGVILQRPNSSGTVYVYGQIPSNVEPVTFGAGQTLVSPPYTNATVEVNGVKYVDLNAAKWTGVKGTTLKRLVGRQNADYVQFRNSDGGFVKYYYLDGVGGGWGVTPTEEARFGEMVKGGRALVPVGTALWYYSTTGGAKVEWM